MKYIMVDSCGSGDEFVREFDDRDEAIRATRGDWEQLSDFDKQHRVSFLLIESADPAEESEKHFDGDIILDMVWEWQVKKRL
jgi:hypothetical protein